MSSKTSIEFRDRIETELIDTHGLAPVLAAIAEICREKAMHLTAHWQDRITARHWDRVATKIETVAERAYDLGL